MPPTSSTIAVTNSTGITLTLESTGILLGILVSASVLGAMAVQLITKMNKISSSIAQIEEAMKEHARDAEKIRQLEKTLDLHIQEYVNRKDVIQMVLGQLDQKINHKFKRLLFYTRDVQRFLQKDTNFSIREYEENTQEE
ncbi:hypothetical protein GNF10_17335 [Nostoc sp. UCD121]|uniref:hypothetical protein n=1 Tax=unclassified Nostoc TaxID=2593658 RepID=UPI0016232EDA|nr:MULTISPECIES: hypothetical protein [unclassified Nostoc]MBC1218490.1 hypothetical protein [Nostoc sp. UCD120]MBC1277672.1 hypothetical protein [Nostoc sp. UCD121]MBC1296208.1 hypothetical protein [Nostoc sp. UCD122]